MAEEILRENEELSEQEMSEIVKVRRDKLAALVEAGKDPFVRTKYDYDAYSSDIKENFEKYEGKTVKIAGRMMSRRIMGKASFAGFRDRNGNIQIYVRRDDV